MSYGTACPSHPYPVRSCASCHALEHSSFLRAVYREPDPAKLLRLRERYGDDPADHPDPADILTDEVDSDGLVTRVRPLSAAEWLELLIRDCRGEVS